MRKTKWDELPVILNTKEVSELTGYGQQTIRELCHAKSIPFFRWGRAFMFPRDKVKEWIDNVAMENLVRGV